MNINIIVIYVIIIVNTLAIGYVWDKVVDLELLLYSARTYIHGLENEVKKLQEKDEQL